MCCCFSDRAEDAYHEVVKWLGCLPLAERGLGVIQRGKCMRSTVGDFRRRRHASQRVSAWVYLPIALGAVVAH